MPGVRLLRNLPPMFGRQRSARLQRAIQVDGFCVLEDRSVIHHRTRNPGLRMSRLCIIAQGFLCVICEFGVSWKRSSLYPDPMKTWYRAVWGSARGSWRGRRGSPPLPRSLPAVFISDFSILRSQIPSTLSLTGFGWPEARSDLHGRRESGQVHLETFFSSIPFTQSCTFPGPPLPVQQLTISWL